MPHLGWTRTGKGAKVSKPVARVSGIDVATGSTTVAIKKCFSALAAVDSVPYLSTREWVENTESWGSIVDDEDFEVEEGEIMEKFQLDVSCPPRSKADISAFSANSDAMTSVQRTAGSLAVVSKEKSDEEAAAGCLAVVPFILTCAAVSSEVASSGKLQLHQASSTQSVLVGINCSCPLAAAAASSTTAGAVLAARKSGGVILEMGGVRCVNFIEGGLRMIRNVTVSRPAATRELAVVGDAADFAAFWQWLSVISRQTL